MEVLKPKLYILKGLPASGKSSWANKFLYKNQNVYIVNRDALREMLCGKYQNFPFGNSAMEAVVTEGVYSITAELLRRNKSVILDETNLNQKRLNSFVTTLDLSSIDFDTEIIDFTHIPVEVCIERDALRDYPVGKHIIQGMHKKYLQ